MLRMANAAVGLVLLLLVGVLPARAPIAGTPVTYADRLAAYQAVYPPVHTCYQKLKRGADAWAECKRGWASSKAAANSSFFILFMDCWPPLQAAAEALQRVPAARRTGGSQAVKAETERAADNLDKANKCIMEGNEDATRLLQEARSGAPSQTAGQGPISGHTQMQGERPVATPPLPPLVTGTERQQVIPVEYQFAARIEDKYGQAEVVTIKAWSDESPGTRKMGPPEHGILYKNASAYVTRNQDGSVGVFLKFVDASHGQHISINKLMPRAVPGVPPPTLKPD